eukprot:352817-Chlamydomonas_euryale.AAC.5
MTSSFSSANSGDDTYPGDSTTSTQHARDSASSRANDRSRIATRGCSTSHQTSSSTGGSPTAATPLPLPQPLPLPLPLLSPGGTATACPRSVDTSARTNNFSLKPAQLWLSTTMGRTAV